MRVVAISLCFNNPRVIEASIRRFHFTKNPNLPVEHVLVDQCYPLPDKRTVAAKIEELAAEFPDITVLKPGKNLGLHKGFNWAISQLNLNTGDIVIGYDPDCNPVDPGWDMALVTALQHPQIAWASLWGVNAERELGDRGFTEFKVAQVRVRKTHTPAVNSICAWKYDFLRESRGLHEPSEFYGGLECAMWPELNRQGKWWVFLPDWRENEEIMCRQDAIYREWKWKHAHEGWPGDLEAYINSLKV